MEGDADAEQQRQASSFFQSSTWRDSGWATITVGGGGAGGCRAPHAASGQVAIKTAQKRRERNMRPAMRNLTTFGSG